MTREQCAEAQALALRLVEPVQGPPGAGWLARVEAAIVLRRLVLWRMTTGQRDTDLDEAIEHARRLMAPAR